MSLNDPIADMLTQIRNAHGAGLPLAEVRFSRIKHEIARVLLQEGFVSAFEVRDEADRKSIRLRLKYFGDHQPAIRGVRRVSRSGLRQYVTARDVPRVLGGMGAAILSTSAGILSDREARKAKIGGEVLCVVW
jgi:small subunit ribosomal protein S8